MIDKLANKVVYVAVLLILAPLAVSIIFSASSLLGSDSEFLQKAAQQDGEKCELETKYECSARFEHMDFLKELRNEAVRDGKRDERNTLSRCWDCHANTTLGTSRAGFCDKCHNVVNLHLNCFGCHHDPDTGLQASE